MHGPQQGHAELWFQVPSACADSVGAGSADVGIIPVVEMDRQALPSVPGLGIASDGPVRSIYMVAQEPAHRIRSIAMDTSSRTSVALAKIVLAQKYGVQPRTIPHNPDLTKMLRVADAALLIGDPALRFEPSESKLDVYDLGAEWKEMTGLPMVYAMWAGRGATEAAELLQASYRYGSTRIEEIIEKEAAPRGFPAELARTYLTRNIQFELGPKHERGLELFLQKARSL
jgi:chorismate dehydratase